MMRKFLLVMLLLLGSLSGCTATPEGVEPVSNFEVDRYLGRWYEIARLDHSFEDGLSQVTATYSPRKDGGITVLNRGYSQEEGEWQSAEGKAYFVEDESTGHLKVSFFGPFYSSYIVFELDQQGYEYAFVSGYNTSYLWLLSRTPTVDDALMDQFIEKARSLGFATEELIFVSHPE
ncbi:lipocalin family protein [Pseudohongiella nitratireducens]|nr:lipocalin family protein [Pseudohongiella nitratireducens]